MKELPKLVFFGGVGLLMSVELIMWVTQGPSNADFVMQSAVTCFVLSASLFVVIAKRYSATDKHWAYATVGTILGFWLHLPK
jgi:hypothetical protein